MALGNTPRKEQIFYVEASKSYAFGMQFNSSAGEPVDLTASVLRVSAVGADGAEVIYEVAEISDPLTGYAQFNLQAADLAIDPASYRYDITLLDSGKYSTPILKGSFEVGANADAYVDNIYIETIPVDVIDVTLDNGAVINTTVRSA